MERYINPFIDFGFKKLFGIEANKDILISFLNAVIEVADDPILDLFPKNVEQIGEFNGDRTCYFDVFCQTANGRRFIVEMQNSWEVFFKDRTLYYAARAIQEQGVKGDPTKRENAEKKVKTKPKKWDYRLNEVYVIALMNFNFPRKEYKPEDYYHKIMLTDLNDNHVFYDKLTLIYLEMPKVGKAKLDMNRPLDRWLWVLYRLWGEEECPPELDEPIFKKLYREAEYACLSPDQQLNYMRSWKKELDTYNRIESGRILGYEEGHEEGYEEGREEGRAKGLEEGREEGREEGLEEGYGQGYEQGIYESKKEIAQKMKERGLDDDTIFQLTGIREF